MGFLIGFLTFVLVLICIALILLVLVQLPKKESGAGLAFGGAATDALFGAGSGNMLTKITKYFAGAFFILAIGLGILQSAFNKGSSSDFQRELDKQAQQPAGLMTPPPVEATPQAAVPTSGEITPSPAATLPAATTNN